MSNLFLMGLDSSPLWGFHVPIMKTAMQIDYSSLGLASLVKVFELADLLGVTPKVAAETLLRLEASKSKKEDAA